MDNNYPFINLNDLDLSKKKKICLFGSGLIAKKTIDFFSDQKIDKIYDNSKNLWNEIFKGLKIYNPNKIKKGEFIIITSSSFGEISQQLVKKKLLPYKDFIISPVLNNIKIISELENKKIKLIFSSGAPPNKNRNFGGGLYQLEINKFEWNCKKILSGNCYGILKKDGKFYVVDEERGILKLSKKLKIEKKYPIPKNLRPHGLSFHKKTNKYFLNSTEQDSVYIFDKNFKLLETVAISKKKLLTGIKHHHINDNLIIDDSLYVSMFSYSGNYIKEVYDGVILEYNLLNLNEQPRVVKDGLWMPHNIKYFNKSLFVLNSLAGEFLGYNMQTIGKFPAFTRGLAYDGKHFFIGQSKNRNYSKYLGLNNNISIDAGVIMFDEKTKVSRYFQIDPRISEVHSIEIID